MTDDTPDGVFCVLAVAPGPDDHARGVCVQCGQAVRQPPDVPPDGVLICASCFRAFVEKYGTASVRVSRESIERLLALPEDELRALFKKTKPKEPQ